MQFLQKNLGTALKLILFTLFSIMVRGYEYGDGNQVHYFNFAFHRFYPEFYSSDYLFKLHDVPYTIFIHFLYVVLKIFGENSFVFFTIYFLFLLLFYTAIYLITTFFFKNRTISLITLLLFIFPIPIGGSTINTVEKSLIPRFVAEIFLMFSIYFLFIKRNVLSPVLAGIGFLFHPITLIPYIPIVILSPFFENMHIFSLKEVSKVLKKCWKPIILKVSIFLIVAGPILCAFILSGQSGTLFMDASWKSIVLERMPYVFVTQWSVINFLLLFSTCIFFGTFTHFFKKKINPTVQAILFVSLGFFTLAFLSAIFTFRLGLQLQLARNLYLFVVFALIYGVGSALARLSKVNLKKASIILLIISVALCLPGRNRYGILWVNPLSEYQQAAIWAKTNTPNDSLFIVPLDTSGFRFWSKRSVFLELKEGGDGLYNRNFAMVWNDREELIEEERQFTITYLLELKKEFNVSYILTTQDISGLTAVYKNKKYTLYKI